MDNHHLRPVVRCLFILMCSWYAFVSVASADQPDVSRYNVVWDSPSQNHHGSMPLGNGQTSLNAWIEPSGDLCFYIGRTDSWGDNARLLKVGKVRVSIEPVPSIQPFKQALSLSDGTMSVNYGEGDDAASLNLWVDANHPVIHVTIDSSKPITATAAIELWRTQPQTLPSIEVSDVMFDRSQPNDMHAPTIVLPDTLLIDETDRIGWYHRNVKSVGPAEHARVQGMSEYPRQDPLLGRTFGAIITATNPQRIDDTHLRSPDATEHRFDIFVDTLHPATVPEWLARMDEHIAQVKAIGSRQCRGTHEKWWTERWSRSWIVAEQSEIVSGYPQSIPADDSAQLLSHQQDPDDAVVVSRGYALQRYLDICAGRGAYPIKFNGSIFTVPYDGQPGDADYRRWGPGYWWQNTRLPYLSMCTSGDTDLMQPLFQQYIDRFLPLNEYRTQHYFGHDGAYYIECVHFWGDVFNETYGWTPVEDRDDKLQEAGWHKWEWVAGPELVYMALDYYDHVGDTGFLQEKLLPTASAVLTFFDQHYQVNDSGKLVFEPSQALETWWDCTNAMPEIAGLIAVTDRLLALDESLTTPQQRAYWSAFRSKLPDLPTRDIDGQPAFAPAERFAAKHNIENPELYCVFPFRLASFNRPNAELAINALEHRWDRGHSGWRQDDLFMAYLGLTQQARSNLVARARSSDRSQRFPAFWGPNYDWTPDQDHGGILMKAFQAMLMQAEPATGSEYDNRIYLLPAWPKNWNVKFKLHAPQQTIVEGEYRDGEMVQLNVTPETRRRDVVYSSPSSPARSQ